MNISNSNTDSKIRSKDKYELPKTLKLNVGGTKFDVPRTLIVKDDGPDTLLSRMVSDTRYKDGSEIFIDRNGELFSYVLEYLKCGNIMVPITVCYNTLMREFDLFGIPLSQGSVTREDNAWEYFAAKEKKVEEQFIGFYRKQQKYKEAVVQVHEKKLKYHEAVFHWLSQPPTFSACYGTFMP